MAKITRLETWILRVMAGGCVALLVFFFVGIMILTTYVRSATASVQQLASQGDLRYVLLALFMLLCIVPPPSFSRTSIHVFYPSQIALNWILENNRFDDVKRVLDTVVRWLERVVFYDHATGQATSILIDVSNDGEFSFLARYMSNFNRIPADRYVDLFVLF
jgi:hypothetical protein